ncbi:ommochrome-binding protein-like [Amyelois transitella]|uniref:ommochrome-binding protein-like n=1 Tax=Amyelois transitella TaxID=680683 RepID=UPI002990476F|nr:ommochrome-binding protein-like [Amyelois transitella]
MKTINASQEFYNSTCENVKINDNWYKRDILWSHVKRPMNLNVHRSSNTLFFSYSVSDSYVDIDVQIGYMQLNTGETGGVEGVIGGCAIAIDQYDDIIYLGGSKGIYTYNMFTKKADEYREYINVWALFYNRFLFYISFPYQKLHVEVNGKFITVTEFVNIEVDHYFSNDREVFIANKSGLFKYNVNEMKIETINDVILVRHITEDNLGNVYVCSNVGVFLLKDGKLHVFIESRSIYSLAFDNRNNIIYSTNDDIVRLSRTDKGCFDENY